MCVCARARVCVAESREEMQHMVNVLDRTCTRWGMSISGGKTKLLAVREQQPGEQPPITLKGQALEEVESFPYLGSEVQKDGKMEKEVTVRLQKQGPSTKCGDRKYLEATF